MEQNVWKEIDELASKIGVETEAHLFPPYLDFIFKAIFTQNSNEAEIARIDLLSSILGMEVKSAEVLQNELAVTDENEKQSTMDVHIRLDGGEEINVEIQLRNNDNMINRSEYYICKLFSSQNAKGIKYKKLNKVFEIMITNFTLFEGREEFTNEFMYRNEEGEVLSGNTKIIFMELSKLSKLLKKPVDEMTGPEAWCIFLRYGSSKRHSRIISEIQNKKEGIRMAGEILNNISSDRAMQLQYIDRLKFEIDQESKLDYALSKGISEGITKGRDEKAVEIALNMLKRGGKPEHVAQDSGLTLEKVLELTKQTDIKE